MFEWIKILGGAAGVVALIWRFMDEFGSYLRISIKVEPVSPEWATALTSVENNGNRPKNLSYAFLLVSPESETLKDSAEIIAAEIGFKGRLKSTNDFKFLRAPKPIYAGGCALIPLTFYYLENVDIADEALTYRALIDLRQLREGIPYAVRFFVFGKWRLHRSTHDLFFNTPAQAAAQHVVGPERGSRVL